MELTIGKARRILGANFSLDIVDEGGTVLLQINGRTVLFFSKTLDGRITCDLSRVEGDEGLSFLTILDDGYLEVIR